MRKFQCDWSSKTLTSDRGKSTAKQISTRLGNSLLAIAVLHLMSSSSERPSSVFGKRNWWPTGRQQRPSHKVSAPCTAPSPAFVKVDGGNAIPRLKKEKAISLRRQYCAASAREFGGYEMYRAVSECIRMAISSLDKKL